MADSLYADICWAAREDRRTDIEVIQRALTTYLWIRKEVRGGKILGFSAPDQQESMHTRIDDI
jgi:hypothetical protein